MPSVLSIQINNWLQSSITLWAWLRASSILVVGAVVLYYVMQSDKIAQVSFQKHSISEIKAKIKEEHQSNFQLKRKVKASGFFNFKELTENGEFQYIYSNGNLVFWGDNHYLPEYVRTKGEYSEKYIEQKAGKFLVVKDTLRFKGEVFEIVNLVPLYFTYDINNQYIHSGPNAALFDNQKIEINNYHLDKDLTILGSEGNYLFSVQMPDNFNEGVGWLNFIVIASIAFFLIFLSAFVWSSILRFQKKLNRYAVHSNWAAFFYRHEADFVLLLLFLYALSVRFVLLFTQLPHSVFNIRFFNPRYYNWYFLTPTPGDLLLHLLFVITYFLLVKHYFRKTWIFDFLMARKTADHLASNLVKILVLNASHFSLFFVGIGSVWVFSAIGLPLDISELISFDVSSVLTTIFILLAGGLFIGMARLGYELISKNVQKGVLYQYAPSVLSFLVIAYFIDFKIGAVVAILHLVFFALSYFFKLPSTKHSFDYAALVFFTIGSLVTAFMISYSLLQLYPKKDVESKRAFITQQLVENNLLGESLLNEISEQVATDPYIANAFSNPMFSIKDIEEKVRRFYLGNYLNRYDIQVMAFDITGKSLNEDDSRTFFDMRNRFPFKLYKTNYPEVFYYITQQNQILKNYLGIVSIFKNGFKEGLILIDLQPKKFIPNSILPALLLDKKSHSQHNNNQYSYAVLNNGELTNSFGNYNFRKELIEKILIDSLRYNSNIEFSDGYFLVSDLGKGRKIIVQSEAQSNWVTISNMSFLFVLMELSVSLFFIGNLLLFNFDRFYNSLTFKIQFYSIMAFFIPIGLVSSGVLTAVISSYNQELQVHFKENAINISHTLSEDLEKYYVRGGSIDNLNESVLRTARLYNTDVNIFRKNGMLLVSSSPVLFKAGLMSPLVDPLAFFAIRQEKNKLYLQKETIGKLHYNHVYIQVRSSENGEELGIISIPFFASGKELSNRITNALRIIINISTLTFMVFIFFSFTASGFITTPLKLITNRIKKTTLDANNRPLEWKSKDELGLLIREYNLMLQKLEQNKRSLAISQKESAWREVAQQVAHEIKNPLTPIKLSLQHIRRVLQNGPLTEPVKMDKTIESLIGQVENLDGIASSFSIYAKMPAFSLEMVDLKMVINQVLDIYANEKREFVHCELFDEGNLVLADERMLGRILANLLLNAFQAVPSDRTPEIKIQMQEKGEFLLLSISDNGSGIPIELADKVFEPHFSTKFSGSGIGLYIARKGIEQMGGTITFETSELSGTSFKIELRKA
jgi:two-component system, NtrC family, nitrogen regulation sensor histidine kinase NtrY